MRPEHRIEFLRKALYDIAARAGGFLEPKPHPSYEFHDERAAVIEKIRSRASVALLDDEKRRLL